MVRRSSSSGRRIIVIWEVIVKIHTIGIDLSKTTFHVVGLDEKGAVVLRRKQSRKQLLIYTANLPSALIGMEACGGAHYLGRALEAQGHQFV
jgi:transposase